MIKREIVNHLLICFKVILVQTLGKSISDSCKEIKENTGRANAPDEERNKEGERNVLPLSVVCLRVMITVNRSPDSSAATTIETSMHDYVNYYRLA